MNTHELRQHLEPLAGGYPRPQTAVVPLLHALLDSAQPLDDESIGVVADICQVNIGSVRELIGHYALFQREHEPKAAVCFGLPCYLSGAQQVFDRLQNGGSAEVRNVTMSPCLGHCYAAPVLQLEDGTICKVNPANSAE